MFIVRRTSLGGGSSQYLVEGASVPYRWAKTRKSEARMFTTKSSASRIANKYSGRVVAI